MTCPTCNGTGDLNAGATRGLHPSVPCPDCNPVDPPMHISGPIQQTVLHTVIAHLREGRITEHFARRFLEEQGFDVGRRSTFVLGNGGTWAWVCYDSPERFGACYADGTPIPTDAPLYGELPGLITRAERAQRGRAA